MESPFASHFQDLLPEVVFEAIEHLGGRATGRFYALNAMENRVYDVEFEQGPRKVIKFYRPGRWSEETIQTEHTFLEALVKAEIPAVAPEKDMHGQSIFKIQSIFFAIFPKKQGRLEAELSPEKLKRLGRFLARIHNVGETLKLPRNELNVATFALDPLQYLEANKLIPTPFDQRFNLLVTTLAKILEPIYSRFPKILLHGDCHSGNVLWNADDPFFIDFDDCLYAPPVQDIWMLTGSDDEYGKSMRETLLESYTELRSFNMESLCLIEPLRTLRMIHFNHWIAKRWQDPSFQRAFPNFGTERYWQEQIEALSIQQEKISNWG